MEKEKTDVEETFQSLEKDNHEMMAQIEELQQRLGETEEKAGEK